MWQVVSGTANLLDGGDVHTAVPHCVRQTTISTATGAMLPTLDLMARYAIDAPTLLYLVDRGVTVDPSHQLVAPNSIRSEALEMLLRQVRNGARSEEQALELHERMTTLKMRLLGDRVSRRTAWQIAVAQGWDTLRDAEYLAVARLQADALVTVDPDLAAKASSVTKVGSIQDLLLDR